MCHSTAALHRLYTLGRTPCGRPLPLLQPPLPPRPHPSLPTEFPPSPKDRRSLKVAQINTQIKIYNPYIYDYILYK